MTYDFDTKINRLGTDSIKWDVQENELPMWVADMDFLAAPEIREAFIKRIEHGIFGYANVPDEWYEAYQSWWSRRHHFIIEKEWLIFCTGVIPAMSSIIRKLVRPDENVLIVSPTYNHFYNSIRNNGARVLECPIIYRDGDYTIDFDDLESKLSDSKTKLMIWCNPQNPVGKIWDVETMKIVGDLCKKYQVTVIADEIHCDIVRPGMEYTPFASVSDTCREISITTIAPTKAFNIAGLHSAACCIPNEEIRNKIKAAFTTDENAEPNSFATVAAITAFNKGEKWLMEMCEYVYRNRDYVEDYIAKNIPSLSVIPGNATYLMWIDISKVFKDGIDAYKYMRSKTGLFVTNGNIYGQGGEKYIRLNIACPLEYVKDGMDRFKRAVDEKIRESI